MQNTHHISDPLFQDIIENTHLPKTVFTQKLKAFYKSKKCTASHDCLIDPKDAIVLLPILCTKVSDPSVHQDEQYSSARLIRLSLSWKLRESIFVDIFADMLEYMEKNALHSNGNVRNEILFLFGDFLFSIDILVGPRYPRKTRNKKEQNHVDIFVPPLIAYHKRLVLQECEYIQKHHDNLWETDTHDLGFIPFSGDTHDKTLARIRRVLECMDYPYLMNIFETYGYTPYEKDNEVHMPDFNKEFSERLRAPLIDPIVFQKDLQFFLILSGISTTVDEIQKHIFHADTLSMLGNRVYQEWFISLLENKHIELTQEILDVMTTAWNVFPHQQLGEISPQDKAQELYGDR